MRGRSVIWKVFSCHDVAMANDISALQWRHNELECVSDHQPHDCLLKRLFRHRSKKTSKLRVTVICAGNSPVTGEFPVQRASNAENASIWWRHHGLHQAIYTYIYVFYICAYNKQCMCGIFHLQCVTYALCRQNMVIEEPRWHCMFIFILFKPH